MKNFLLASALALLGLAIVPSLALADTSCPGRNPCTPERLPNHVGTDHSVAELMPELCLSQEAFDLMTVAIKNGKAVRLPVVWDYGLYYGKKRPPEVFNTHVHQQCQSKQSLHSGTTVIVWFNCRDRSTGKWIRHWLATTPVHDNSTYTLVEYASEEVSGYNDTPRVWKLPR
jgi:hypothetical protein